MLELVKAQHGAEEGGELPRTGAHDLLQAFELKRYYQVASRSQSRNWIQAAAKEVASGIPGDLGLYVHPSWSLLKPRLPGADDAAEPSKERIQLAFRLAPGGAVLPKDKKGADVTGVFMRNVTPPPPRPGPEHGAGSGAHSGSMVSGKRQADSGDNGSLTTMHQDFKRKRVA